MKRGLARIPFLHGLVALFCICLLTQCTPTSSVHRAPPPESVGVQAPLPTPQEQLEQFNLFLDRG
ncbi:MAG TPA: hypothetical protein VGX03_24000 [Candidatus Binatia bacterium]|jgi:hypothetical protein|nr:hypothetical protein [Candidatus Binatia bacterium]